jgi:hypothetical protein
VFWLHAQIVIGEPVGIGSLSDMSTVITLIHSASRTQHRLAHHGCEGAHTLATRNQQQLQGRGRAQQVDAQVCGADTCQCGSQASRRSGVALQWAVCRVKTGDETRDGCAALPQAQTATVQLKGSLARLLHQAVAQCTKFPNSHEEKSPLLRPGLEPQCTPDPCRQHQHSMSR